jgi:hypothetical protein
MELFNEVIETIETGENNLTQEEYDTLYKLLIEDTQNRIQDYLQQQILTPENILYYIKCVKNDEILPMCLTEDNLLEVNDIKRLLVLSLSKKLLNFYDSNYE